MAAEKSPTKIDTSNKWLLGAANGDYIVSLMGIPRRLSNQDALLLAAWLVALVGDDDLWERTLKAVQST